MGLEGEKNTGRGFVIIISQLINSRKNDLMANVHAVETTTEDLAAEDAGFIYKKETANPNDTLVISSNL
jgi:hypothetical protein